MSRFIFVYLAHGGRQFRKQAELSIASLASHGPIPGDILVYTDRPADFEGLPATPVPFTKDQKKRWRGPYGFTHRVKTELVRHVFLQTGKNVVFIDSDTFWTNGPERICESLESGHIVMQERENILSESFFPQYLAVMRKHDLLERAGFPVHDPAPIVVYNSGVIGLPRTLNPEILDQVVRFCDFFCRNVPRTMEWAEQFAFSYIFQTAGPEIKTCDGDLCHYWRTSFEVNRRIQNCTRGMLLDLARDSARLHEIVQEGNEIRRTFGNQVLTRTKRLQRSFRKRKREFLVFLESLRNGGRKDS